MTVNLSKPQNNVLEVKIEYKSSEPVKITLLRIFFDEVDENTLTDNSNDQTI